MRKTELWVIVYIFLVIFIAMSGYFVYSVQFGTKEVINDTHNTRKKDLEKQVIRGTIYASDGSVLAQEALNSEGEEVRNYPYKEMFAHVVGYSVMGSSGVENAADVDLLTSNAPVSEKLQKEMSGIRNTGDSIYTKDLLELLEELDPLKYTGDNEDEIIKAQLSSWMQRRVLSTQWSVSLISTPIPYRKTGLPYLKMKRILPW